LHTHGRKQHATGLSTIYDYNAFYRDDRIYSEMT
jgi:hypothetical protein